jgi:hypothetical protein
VICWYCIIFACNIDIAVCCLSLRHCANRSAITHTDKSSRTPKFDCSQYSCLESMQWPTRNAIATTHLTAGECLLSLQRKCSASEVLVGYALLRRSRRIAGLRPSKSPHTAADQRRQPSCLYKSRIIVHLVPALARSNTFNSLDHNSFIVAFAPYSTIDSTAYRNHKSNIFHLHGDLFGVAARAAMMQEHFY